MLSSYFISYLVMMFKVFVEALRRKLANRAKSKVEENLVY